jgi:nucleotide-binding universal stress UspA family protein
MKKLLVPTDFSTVANNAVHYALALAKIFKSEVIIFHALAKDEKDLHHLRDGVDKFTRLEAGMKINFVSSHKHFSSITINEFVSSHKIDFIVMGTSGDDAPFEKTLFGKETAEIAEHASCPVIAVPGQCKFAAIKNIAYACDLNFIDKEVGTVIQFAKKLHAYIDLFHVTPVFPDIGNTEKINMRDKLAEIKENFKYNSIHYSLERTDDDNEIVEGINSFLDECKADMLVMFHHHDTVFEEFISTSHTAEIIEDLKIPLLIFPRK